MSGNWHASRKALVGVVFSVCTEPIPVLPARDFFMNNEQKNKKEWASVASLSMGIVSIFLWEFSIIPVLAIILGVVGLVRDEKKWKAGIGLALGIIFIIVRISQGHIDRGIFSSSSPSNDEATQTTPLQPYGGYRVVPKYDPPAATNTDAPEITSYVNDNARVLSVDAKTSLVKKLIAFSESGSNEIAVLTIKTLNGLSVEEFAIQVTQKWQRADNGILLVIATDERKVRIEVGRNVTITDVQAGQILDDIIVPRLRRDDFAGAINDGVDAIIKLVNSRL